MRGSDIVGKGGREGGKEGSREGGKEVEGVGGRYTCEVL